MYQSETKKVETAKLVTYLTILILLVTPILSWGSSMEENINITRGLPHENNIGSRRIVSSNAAQVSMVSYLCSELLTGVDVYKEFKEISKGMWNNYLDNNKTLVNDTGSSWNFNLNVRTGDVSLKATINNGDLGFGMGKVRHGEMASANLEVRF